VGDAVIERKGAKDAKIAMVFEDESPHCSVKTEWATSP
jgi:hypothetical protein